MKIFPALRFFGPGHSAVLLFVLTIHSSAVGATVSLKCPSDIEAKRETLLEINCTLRNRGLGTLYLYAAAPIFEGPKDDHALYIYSATEGERYENTIQYNKKSVGTLDLPVTLDPTIHIRLKDLRRLVRVGPGEKTELKLMWKLGMGKYPNVGEWLVQLKMIYLSETGASNLLHGLPLPPVCRLAMARAISDSGRKSRSVRLVPVRRDIPFKPVDGRTSDETVPQDNIDDSVGALYDGCHDAISAEFSHIFSNIMTLIVVR